MNDKAIEGGLRKLRECPKCGLGMPDSHVCKTHVHVFDQQNALGDTECVCGETPDGFMFPENKPAQSDTRGEVTSDAIRDKSIPAPLAPAVCSDCDNEDCRCEEWIKEDDQATHPPSATNPHEACEDCGLEIAFSRSYWRSLSKDSGLCRGESGVHRPKQVPPSAEVEAAGPDDYRLIRQLLKSELARGRDNGLANEHAIELIDKFSALREENERLRAECKVSEQEHNELRLAVRVNYDEEIQQLADIGVPECPLHGGYCAPHVAKWMRETKKRAEAAEQSLATLRASASSSKETAQ